jgi:anti-sigma-K factor RskA
MHATSPAADHSEEFEQLAGLQALRVLEGDDLARFDEHAARCERCRLIMRLDRETLRELSLAAPEMDPSPGFKERLMQRAAAELAQAPPPPPEPIPIRPRTNVVDFRRSRAWLTSLAAVLVLALGGYAYMNQVIASYQLTGSVAGSATVHVRRSGAVELQMQGLAAPPAGFLYEAWIIPPGGQPVAAGTNATGTGTLPLREDARGKIVALTLERAPGVDAPTSAPLLAGSVES